MDVNLLREIVTVVSFGTFAGIVWWAMRPRNARKFEEAARQPLQDE